MVYNLPPYLIKGLTEGGLGAFNGTSRKKTVYFFTQPNCAINNARTACWFGKGDPVILILKEPKIYSPELVVATNDTYIIYLGRPPFIDINSPDVAVLTNPTLGQLTEFLDNLKNSKLDNGLTDKL